METPQLLSSQARLPENRITRSPQSAQPPRPADDARPARDRVERSRDTAIEVSIGLQRTYLRFVVEDAGRVRLRVIDARTDEVIREIPPEELVRVSEALREYQEHALRRRLSETDSSAAS